MESACAPGPLSREEIEREEVKKAENNVAVAVDTKHQTMSGLLFPMTREAERAVAELRAQHLDYVQLSIDVGAETIRLEAQESGARAGGGRVTPVDVVERTPEDRPRYHVYVFRYTHEGDARVSTGQ